MSNQARNVGYAGKNIKNIVTGNLEYNLGEITRKELRQILGN